jgi:hypothetical protein
MSSGRENSDSPEPPGRRVADLIGRHGRKFAGGLVTLIVAPVAVALISNALSGDNSKTDAGVKLGPGLRADKLVVRNPLAHAVQTEAVIHGVKQPAFKQTRASMPRVVLTISNTGDRRAVLTGMVFTVRDYAELRPCQAGAATNLSGEYQVRLPVPARRGQSIGLDLDRNIAPDGVDRFALRFAVPFKALNLGGEQLYILDVAAQVSPVARPQRLGTIAISAPGIPDALGLKEGVPNVPGETLPAWLRACGARHHRDLERIANHPGVTTDPRLKAVAEQAARIDARERK